MRRIKLFALVFILAQSFAFAQNSSVEVRGEAEMAVEPIGLMVEVSILNREKSADKALKATAKSVEKIAKVINKNEGISSFSTNDVSIEGNWNKTDKAYEYISVQTLTIRIDSILAYDKVMDKLSGAGINQISKVSYIVADEEGKRMALLGQAVANAKQKALAIAKASGKNDVMVAKVAEVPT